MFSYAAVYKTLFPSPVRMCAVSKNVVDFLSRSRVNTNILTRRLCRNRSCDENELYRSNSFKFERFRRDDTDAGIVSVNTLPKQVSKTELGPDCLFI